MTKEEMKDRIVAILNEIEDVIENAGSSKDWVRGVLDARRELAALVAEVEMFEKE